MRYITLLLLVTTLTSCFRAVTVPNPRYAINDNINFDGKKSDEIFDKTEMWMARTFVDSRSVMEVKNRDGRMIYGNAIINIATKSKSYQFEMTLEIYVRDNQLKLEISNINMNGYYGSGYELKKYFTYFEDESITKTVKDKFHIKINELTKSLETFVNTPTW